MITWKMLIGCMSCHNSPTCLEHTAWPQRNVYQTEMKIWLLKIRYANFFACLDQEDPYTHLTKFYGFSGTLWASETEEKAIFMILFPCSLIGKSNEWYLYKLTSTMKNWNVLEEKFLNIFFSYNKFIEAKVTII